MTAVRLFVHVEDRRPQKLPRAWRNVSGLHLLPDADLRAHGWLPYVHCDQPEYDDIHDRLIAGLEITDTAALRTWTVERKPADMIPSVQQVADLQVARIKAACGDVIVARYPEHKQRNMLARGLELSDIQRARRLTAEEDVELDAIRDAWAWIKLQRAESNRLEAQIGAVVGSDDERRRAIARVVFVEVS